MILRSVFVFESLFDDRKELAQCELLDNEVLQAIPSCAFLPSGIGIGTEVCCHLNANPVVPQKIPEIFGAARRIWTNIDWWSEAL